MIIISATIDLEAETRDACVEASIPFQRATRNEEPGCLAYCFGADPVEPTRIQVYELWENEAALKAHFDHPNYHAMRQLLGTFGLRQSVSRKYRTDLDEPVYDHNRTPRADFFTAAS